MADEKQKQDMFVKTVSTVNKYLRDSMLETTPEAMKAFHFMLTDHGERVLAGADPATLDSSALLLEEFSIAASKCLEKLHTDAKDLLTGHIMYTMAQQLILQGAYINALIHLTRGNFRMFQESIPVVLEVFLRPNSEKATSEIEAALEVVIKDSHEKMGIKTGVDDKPSDGAILFPGTGDSEIPQ